MSNRTFTLLQDLHDLKNGFYPESTIGWDSVSQMLAEAVRRKLGSQYYKLVFHSTLPSARMTARAVSGDDPNSKMICTPELDLGFDSDDARKIRQAVLDNGIASYRVYSDQVGNPLRSHALVMYNACKKHIPDSHGGNVLFICHGPMLEELASVITGNAYPFITSLDPSQCEGYVIEDTPDFPTTKVRW